MRNLYFLTIIALIAFCSCKNNCKEDLAFKEKFFHNIFLAEQLRHYNDSIHALRDRGDTVIIDSEQEFLRFEDVFEGIGLNAIITGIDMPLQQEGGPLFYNNTDSIIAAWKNWYEENKCNMTMRKVDSIYFEHYGAWKIALEIFNTRIAEEKKKNPNYSYSAEDIYIIEDSIRKSRR